MLGLFGNMTVEGKTIEQILLDLLEKRGMKKLWAYLKSICSRIRPWEPLWILLERSERRTLFLSSRNWEVREGPWTPRLREALKKIEARANPPKP